MKTKFLYSIVIVLLFATCEQSSDDMGYSPGKSMESSGGGSGSSGQGGSLARFTIRGNYLYTVDMQYLKVFDISNDQSPEYRKKINAGFDIETIFSRDETLFLGSQSGMYIYDISAPANPVKISHYEHIVSCDPVVADDRYAYVTLHSEDNMCGRTTNELQIVDISDLKDPYKIKSYDMYSPRGLGIDGNILFVCDDGLKVYDASNVRKLKLKHHFDIVAHDVIPADGNLFVIGSDGFYQYEYDNDTISLLSQIEVAN